MASFGRVSLYYDPLHRERCIGLLDNGHPCPHDVDLKWRNLASKSVTENLLCDFHSRALVRPTKHGYVPDPPLLTAMVTNDTSRHISPMIQRKRQSMMQEAPSHLLRQVAGGIRSQLEGKNCNKQTSSSLRG
ncbi:hypothetical protein BDQ94DRAFT_163759 [Aspergillus welwitschiae]|uniref:Uncharacterized protein n=1 Tax=Aspergillus welwitschiae TaxID=1341132 RepID=A0A3F3PLR3_9EURO|nr:hypothetical protein BDQ94DRAFT_163759 [Aspergillus welwitschiae]RDH27296.1 hypothetical protein BDQ94DRAFT_163759 [Aspergillus welwitschiae]